MFTNDISGSFINEVPHNENKHNSEFAKHPQNTDETEKTFHKDLQKKLEKQQIESFQEKEREKKSYTSDIPSDKHDSQEINEISQNNETTTNIKTHNDNQADTPKSEALPQKTTPDIKQNTTYSEVNKMLEKAANILQQLDSENIPPSKEINELLANLAELLDNLSTDEQAPKLQLSEIESKIKQIELTNPRTKEVFPINFISKKDFVDLLSKLTNETNNISTSSENLIELTTKIDELLNKLSGIIESSKQETKTIAQAINLKLEDSLEPQINKIEKQNIAINESLETKNNKDTNTNLLQKEEKPQIELVTTKKQPELKNKNEESLFEQNNKQENKEIPSKMISIDNELSEFNTRLSIKDAKNVETFTVVKNSSSNLEKQNQVLNQFRTYLTINKLKTDTEVTMRLYPKELGEIKVKITKEQISGEENAHIVAKFQVSSDAVKSIIENNLSELKNDLQQNSNVLISSLSVEINDKENKDNEFSNIYKKNLNEKITAKKEIKDAIIIEQKLSDNEINSLA